MRYKRERGKEETQLLGQDRKLAKKIKRACVLKEYKENMMKAET